VGWTVERQTFADSTPRGPLTFVNLIARRADADARTPRAIVCAHYDTKWFENFRFVGANDGGSGTGALMELARALGGDPAFARRFELVFFDGEEAVRTFTDTDSLYGSRHYAEFLRRDGRVKQFKLGVLWDMIGDRDLGITLSPDSPPKLARGIFAAAEALGTRGHFGYFRGNIGDDHVPLNRAGIPTIDLIDFEFPAWHTPADTLDKISADSLQIIGQATIYHLCKVAGELN
jgi:glutaminyl-peptide cyclotransferase